MKKMYFLFVLFFIFSGFVFSQKSLSDYAYVLVPQQFEFQKGQDQHQLNTLTRHLFKNAGFNPLYDVELGSLPRCEGLYASVISEPTFSLSRFTVVLRDCNNIIVFESNTGTSKEKEFKKSYHEALKNAFKSIEVLGVNQGDLDSFRESIHSNITDAPIQARSTKDYQTPAPVLTKAEANKKVLLQYNFENEDYFLEKSANDFLLYKKTKTAPDLYKIGVIFPTSRKGLYLLKTGQSSVLVSFDSNDNLLVDALDKNGNPIQNTYVKVD